MDAFFYASCMLDFRHITVTLRISILSTFGMMIIWAGDTHAASSGKPAQAYQDVDTYSACQSVQKCVDILNRHGPESFDYDVLADDFYRLGPHGQRALLRHVETKHQNTKSRAHINSNAGFNKALEILARRAFNLTPKAQAELVENWPNQAPEYMSLVFAANISPVFTKAVIGTLSHPRPEIRDMSREVLARAVSETIIIPIDTASEHDLKSALYDQPHPALIAFLKTGSQDKVFQNLIPALGSGDGDTVLVAYETLFAIEPARAFNALVATLFRLTETDFDAAMALSHLLVVRQSTRPDGFYMRFAAKIIRDKTLSDMGRVAVLEAMVTALDTEQAKTRLVPSPSLLKAFEMRLWQKTAIDPKYISLAVHLESSKIKGWIAALNAYFEPSQEQALEGFKNQDAQNQKAQNQNAQNQEWGYAEFIDQIGTLNTPEARKIVQNSLSKTDNYRVFISAIRANSAQGQSINTLQPLKQSDLQAHPWTAIRVAAKQGLTLAKSTQALQGSQAALLLKRENADAVYCSIPAFDLTQAVRQMPNFEPPILGDGERAVRPNLKTAASLKSGWLAGYAKDLVKPETSYSETTYLKRRDLEKRYQGVGGVFYFDYQADMAKPVLYGNVQAILPVRDLPLGQYETVFWAFMTSGFGDDKEQSIYQIIFDKGAFKTKRIVTYPGVATQIGRLSASDWALSFVPPLTRIKTDYNPPLRLSANGLISRACQTPAQKTELPKRVSGAI